MEKRYFLLVDDDPEDREVFAEAMTSVKEEAELLTAENGQEALKILQNGLYEPDLILLDLNMPLMSGKEFLAVVKKHEYFRHIPVFIFTTSSLSHDVEETLSKGAVCFITKPATFEKLEKLVGIITRYIPQDLPQALTALSKEIGLHVTCNSKSPSTENV